MFQSYVLVFTELYMYKHLNPNEFAVANTIKALLIVLTLFICKSKRVRRYANKHIWFMAFCGIVCDSITESLLLINPFSKLVTDFVSYATFVQLYKIQIDERITSVLEDAESRVQMNVNLNLSLVTGTTIGSLGALWFPIETLEIVVGISIISSIAWYLLAACMFVKIDNYAKNHGIVYPSLQED